ncbi:MAG: metalloprotease PmbA, partial [gamma proteobacterium symbiont of Stewartia floridana]
MKSRQLDLQESVEELLQEAKRQGASAAEAAVSSDAGLSVTVRLGETETIEHTRDNGLGVTVYFGHRKGSASTSDLSPQAIKETVEAACNFARYTSEDDCAGLADPSLMATELPDLDLYHPWNQSVEEAIELAIRCETAARDSDERIFNSEGATLNSHNGLQVYGNTHGFIGGYPSSRHSLSCAVLGKQGESMQRDYWYTLARKSEQLDRAESVGEMAARRTLARLNGRRIKTQQAPVLFQADVAVGLLRSFVGAIRGSSLYRKASFLLDQLGKPVFPSFINIHEDPLLSGGLASCAYDSEGVATSRKDFIQDGVLSSYVLDSYAARKLGMQTTGNGGGVRNLRINSGDQDREGLLKSMQRGLLVTELMGQGVNMVTGDYSRGATGFWIENGEIQ